MSDGPDRRGGSNTNKNKWRYIIGACLTAYNLGCGFGFTSPSLARIEILKGNNENTVKIKKIGIYKFEHFFIFFDFSCTIRELYASSINIGIILGTFLCMTFLKDLKPREILCFSSIPTFIGWACFLVSFNQNILSDFSKYQLELLFIARFITGIAGGFSTMYCPGFLLKSEYASHLSSLFQTSLVFGIFTQQLFSKYRKT